MNLDKLWLWAHISKNTSLLHQEELLDVTGDQIEEFLHSSTTDLIRRESAAQMIRDDGEDVDRECRIPVEKKPKVDSSRPVLADLFNECERVRRMASFDPSSASSNYHDMTRNEGEDLKKNPSCVVHLINALGHPEVMEVLRQKFLENVRRSRTEN